MKKLNENGYTLLELTVAIAIASMLLVGVLGFLVNSIASNSVRTARADLLREAQLALDVMLRDVRLSADVDPNNRIQDVNSPNAAGTGGLGWESNASTLVLATAAEDTAGNIIFADAGHYITEKNNIIYYVSGDTLYKRTLAADLPGNDTTTSCPPASATPSCPADRLSVRNVQSLVFRYYDATNTEVAPANARSVGATLTLQAIKFGKPVTVTYSTRMVFRNE
jgi:prepilin-type N-terminal cleavage/methylation domain-containing protein